MKKILVMLVMLSLVLGIAAAQDGELTISGGVWTGFQIEAGNKYDTSFVGPAHEEGKAYIRPYNDDQKREGLQTQIQADYVTENSGASVRLRARTDRAYGSGDTMTALIKDGHAYGWFKFLPGGIAELSGGLLNNKKWGTYTNFYLDAGFDNRNFTKLDIRPIEGLSFGVNLINQQVGANAAYGRGIEHVFSGTVIGAEYTVPDAFGFRLSAVIGERDANNSSAGSARHGGTKGAQYFWNAGLDKYKAGYLAVVKAQLDEAVNQSLMTQQDANDALADASKAINFDSEFALMWSAFFTGVERLRIDFEGGFAAIKDPTFQTDDTWGTLGIALMGNYGITEQIYAGLRAVFETMAAKEKNPAYLEFRPQAGYTVNDWLAFDLYIPIALAGTGTKGGLDKATMIFGVQPQVTFKLNKSTSLMAYYQLLTSTPDGGDTGIHNTVQLDLIWKF